MNKIERIALWVIVIALVVYSGVITAVVSGELEQINSVLTVLNTAAETGGMAQATPLPLSAPGGPKVGIAGVYVISTTEVMTITASSSGPGDLLYEAPVLQAGSRTYPIEGSSLEKARYAFLDLVTKGQTSAQLVFTAPPADAEVWLVFNPGRQPGDAVAPQVRALVPKPAVLPTPTPRKKP